MNLKNVIKEIINEELNITNDSTSNDDSIDDSIDNSGYFIVRANYAGVFFGKIVSRTHNEVIMNECRKIHYWDGAAAIEQLAGIGTSKPKNCRFTVPVNGSLIIDYNQILRCTEEAVLSLREVPLWIK